MTNIPMTEMSEEFDEYTKFGAKLEPTADGSVSKIREKMFPDVFHLFKKLNIRAIFNAFGPLEGASGFDESAHGLFADAIKGYGCWCLPNQGIAGQDGIWNGLIARHMILSVILSLKRSFWSQSESQRTGHAGRRH